MVANQVEPPTNFPGKQATDVLTGDLMDVLVVVVKETQIAAIEAPEPEGASVHSITTNEDVAANDCDDCNHIFCLVFHLFMYVWFCFLFLFCFVWFVFVLFCFCLVSVCFVLFFLFVFVLLCFLILFGVCLCMFCVWFVISLLCFVLCFVV
jgi:hypothetical protein